MDYTREDQDKVNMICVLMDVVGQYLVEVKPQMRERLKQLTGRSIKQNNLFIKEVDKILHDGKQEKFGEACDKVRELLDNVYLNRNKYENDTAGDKD